MLHAPFMKPLLLLLALLCLNLAQAQKETYPEHPDSVAKPGVPAGEVKGPFPWASTIYPGTTRNYWVYVPAGYESNIPACSLIIQDGLNRAKGWKLIPTMDNLIHAGDMPMTIGIFIDHGQVKPAFGEKTQPRFNRSFEYDGLGDRYARFLLEEILPEVSKSYNLSTDPNDRAIGGASSGAICAFTAAWERPDAFRRVLSTIGTYVGLRGGNEYPTLIRKTENKPLRVYLQDGSSDQDIYAGGWWPANQDMLAALKFAGYDVHHVWGEGGHNSKHAAAIMPDALRWLWRDYPQPIAAGTPAKRRTNLVLPNDTWQLVSEGHRYTEGPAVNAKGEVFFSDVPASKIHKVGLDGSVSLFAEDTGGANGLMADGKGGLVACQMRAKKLAYYNADGTSRTLLEGMAANDLVLLADGSGYFTEPRAQKVWHFTSSGNTQSIDVPFEFPNGIVTTADQAFVWVADSRSSFVYSYQRQADGKLTHSQRYGYLHCPDAESESIADGMTIDEEGRLYVATKLGVQILDQLGRVHLILPNPHPENKKLSNVAFGGPELDTLFVTCTDKVYKRRLKTKGVVPSRGPAPVSKPGL